MSLHRPLQSLSDDQLLSGLADVAGQSRRAESSLVAHIAEVDFRRLYARHACPSMFVYCTRILHLAEGEAFRRIRVARASRRHPVLLEMLADGRLHVSGIAVLVRFLTAENRDRLLSLAAHKTKREIQKLVAGLHPRPDVPSVMRKLPDRPPGTAQPVALVPGTVVDSPPALVSDPAPCPVSAPLAIVEPLSQTRYRIQFTAGEELHDDLERLRVLLRSEIPDGDLGVIVGKAVRELRQRLDARRFAQTHHPRKATVRPSAMDSSRYVTAEVRRAVYRRDRSQCRFTDAQGRRCPERHDLEFHHRNPFALGGGRETDNICLMCPAHNRYLAELDLGAKVMSRHLDTLKQTRLSGSRGEIGPTVPGTSGPPSSQEA
jgi:5-methylcytosine-specific restriction endonuclease McrA